MTSTNGGAVRVNLYLDDMIDKMWYDLGVMESMMNGDDKDEWNDAEAEQGTQTLIRPDQETKTPSLYKVVVHNDDFTPRDFVVHVLKRFFQKSEEQATELMLQVHHKGFGIAGVYTHEIAETKAFQVNELAKENTYPLRTTVEKE